MSLCEWVSCPLLPYQEIKMSCKHSATLSECEVSHVPSGVSVLSPATTDWLWLLLHQIGNVQQQRLQCPTWHQEEDLESHWSALQPFSVLSQVPYHTFTLRFIFCFHILNLLLHNLLNSKTERKHNHISSVKCVKWSKTQIHTDLLANHMTWVPWAAFWHQAKSKKAGRECLLLQLRASEKTSLGNSDIFLTPLMILFFPTVLLSLPCVFPWTFLWAAFCGFLFFALCL